MAVELAATPSPGAGRCGPFANEPSGQGTLAGLLARASAELRAAEDPDRVLDVLGSTVALLCPGRTIWAGWKSPGGPLSHAAIFGTATRRVDARASHGLPPATAASTLEAIIELSIPRLGTGHPAFDLDVGNETSGIALNPAETMTVFPLGSASRVGALVIGVPRGASLAHRSVICVLCDWARIALELSVARGEENRAAALASTLTGLSASSEPGVILDTIVSATAELLDADAAYVMLVNDDRTRLTVRTAHGITFGSFYDMSIRIDEMLPGAAIRDRRVKCLRDVRAHTQARYSRPEGLRSTVCAPMFVKDELLGVLLAAHREVRDISLEDRRLISGLADAAAISIFNTRLSTEREASIRELEHVGHLLAERSRAAERSLAFQRRVTELVLGSDGLEQVIGEITDTFGCAVIVLDGQLAIVHSSAISGVMPDPDTVRDAIVRDNAKIDGEGFSRLAIGSAQALIAPLYLAGERAGYVVVSQARRELESVETAMIEAAVAGIGLRMMCDHAAVEAHARLTAAVFDALVDEREPDSELARRAAQLGYELSGENAAIAVLPGKSPDVPPADRAALRACVERALARTDDGAAGVFEHHGAIVAVLTPGEGLSAPLVQRQAELIRAELDRSPFASGASVAFAGPHDGVGGIRRAIEEAAFALRVCRLLGRSSEPQAFGELGVWTLLGRLGDADELLSFADRVIGALVAYDSECQMRLLETLGALARCNFRYSSAANLMGVHPNTLRYRVSRIAELTNLDFGDLDDRLKAEISLRIFNSIGPPGR